MTHSAPEGRALLAKSACHKLYFHFLRVVALGTLLVTLGAELQAVHFLFEWCTHFRLQAFNASWVLAGGFALVRQWRWMSAMALLTVWHAVAVVPVYYQPDHTSAHGQTELKVMLSNVYSGNSEFDRLLEAIAIEQPDIVVVQELTPAWASALEGLKREYLYRVSKPLEGNFGIGVYSKFPLRHPQILDLTGANIPTLVAEVQLANVPITLLATHPMAPVNGAMAALRNHQLGRLRAMLADLSGPVVLVGDLNTTPWSQSFVQLLTAPMLKTHKFRSAREGVGWLPSWPAALPVFLRIPIDHCLVTDDIDVLGVKLGHNVGSDHLPLVVTLSH